MDILDIDEALKDDSYIFLADKTNDDISNILQQWKANNQERSELQQTTNEQAYKLNSKTFTRPKRRPEASANLESQFINTTVTTTLGMLSLEIGGLVTNMQKSFLQDTSPPSSICLSLNHYQMNNSLISSADFTNINFLESNKSMGLADANNITKQNFTTSETLTSDGGYTLRDMIRDQKMLESFSMSEDGTLVKDVHIGQIDDISLKTLSKTSSACSTMDNSTDSVSMPNEQLTHTQDDMIDDTTFSLVVSLTPTAQEFPSKAPYPAELNRLAEVHTPVLNETQLLEERRENNTFTESFQSPAHCETPENVEKQLPSIYMQSTPLTTTSGLLQNYSNNINNNNHKSLKYTPKGRSEIANISPIVSSTTPLKNYSARKPLYHTFEPQTPENPLIRLELEPLYLNNQKPLLSDMESLWKTDQSAHDATFNMSQEHKQKSCVVEQFYAEEELIAYQGDEEQFEHMLSELGKVNVFNADQLKIQKSLNCIKRRFHKDEHTTQDQQQVDNIDHASLTSTQSQLTSTYSHSNSHSIKSNERLLNRRSRLYDDVNLSVMPNSNFSAPGCNSASFTVCQSEVEPLLESEEIKMPLQLDKQPVPELSCFRVVGRRTRDPERFKTIKLPKAKGVSDEQLCSLLAPSLNDEKSHLQSLDSIETVQPPCLSTSRIDQTSFNYNSEPARNNYLTYKKPKEKSYGIYPHQHSESDLNKALQPRSLSRPRFIVDLKTVSKAISAGDGLSATTSVNKISKATETKSSLVHFEGLASSMGIKSKSFNNLLPNLNTLVDNGVESAINSRGNVNESIRRRSVQTNKPLSLPKATQQDEDKSSIFKVPKLYSGLREPLVGGAKTAEGNGLARPSSGYYSLSVKAVDNLETPKSLSSASSRCSLYSKDTNRNDAIDANALSLKLAQVTTGARGIPKPSGLRQPTQIKRSGLPRPSITTKRSPK